MWFIVKVMLKARNVTKSLELIEMETVLYLHRLQNQGPYSIAYQKIDPSSMESLSQDGLLTIYSAKLATLK